MFTSLHINSHCIGIYLICHKQNKAIQFLSKIFDFGFVFEEILAVPSNRNFGRTESRSILFLNQSDFKIESYTKYI